MVGNFKLYSFLNVSQYPVTSRYVLMFSEEKCVCFFFFFFFFFCLFVCLFVWLFFLKGGGGVIVVFVIIPTILNTKYILKIKQNKIRSNLFSFAGKQ